MREELPNLKMCMLWGHLVKFSQRIANEELNIWETAAGRVKRGQNYVAAACDEFREETGIVLDPTNYHNQMAQIGFTEPRIRTIAGVQQPTTTAIFLVRVGKEQKLQQGDALRKRRPLDENKWFCPHAFYKFFASVYGWDTPSAQERSKRMKAEKAELETNGFGFFPIDKARDICDKKSQAFLDYFHAFLMELDLDGANLPDGLSSRFVSGQWSPGQFASDMKAINDRQLCKMVRGDTGQIVYARDDIGRTKPILVTGVAMLQLDEDGQIGLVKGDRHSMATIQKDWEALFVSHAPYQVYTVPCRAQHKWMEGLNGPSHELGPLARSKFEKFDLEWSQLPRQKEFWQTKVFASSYAYHCHERHVGQKRRKTSSSGGGGAAVSSRCVATQTDEWSPPSAADDCLALLDCLEGRMRRVIARQADVPSSTAKSDSGPPAYTPYNSIGAEVAVASALGNTKR